jgi:hypothetical protein
MVVPRRCDKAIPISYPLKREPCDFRFWPRLCENPATWGAPAHFTAAELLIRWNGPPVVSVATGSFMQALIWSRRGWPHACIASSNPPTPTIIITRFML